MNKLEKILRETPATDKPAADFLSAVMQNVHAEAAAETVRKAALEQLLQRMPADKAGVDFAAEVMQKISAAPQPLLSLWSRVAIAVLVAAVGIIGAFISQPESSFGTVAQKFSALPALNIPPVYALSVLGMSVLLLLDYVLRRKIQKV